jgi:hypothetical protein
MERHALLERLIDYAGQFPPAELDLRDALDEYGEAADGPFGWMLGPFLCPAARLGELLEALAGEDRREDRPLPVGAVLASVDQVAMVATRLDGAATARLVQVEMPRPDDPAPLAEHFGRLDPAPAIYLEARAGEPLGPQVAALDAARRSLDGLTAGGKVRCGGASPAAFPSPDELAGFVHAAVAAGLPCKATAGLHHPFRHWDGDLEVWQHGFVNLLAAVQAAVGGAGVDEIAGVLDLTDDAAFRFGPDGLAWGSAFDGVDPVRVRAALRSYGSCSFAEPTADLVALGVLPAVGR